MLELLALYHASVNSKNNIPDSQPYGNSSDEGENDIIDSEVDGQRYTSSDQLSNNSKCKRKEPKFVESWLEVKEFREWLAKRRGTRMEL